MKQNKYQYYLYVQPKKYINKYNYIFIYDKDCCKKISQPGIYYYKINNSFNIIPCIKNNINYSLIADKSNTYYDDENILIN